MAGWAGVVFYLRLGVDFGILGPRGLGDCGVGAVVDGVWVYELCMEVDFMREGAAEDDFAGVSAAGSGRLSRRGGGRVRKGRPTRLAAGWGAWVARARVLGVGEVELVFELHLRLGMPLALVAEVLGLELKVVQGLWVQGCEGRKVPEPRCEADFVSLREQVGTALWQTVEATFSGLWLGACGAAGGAEGPGDGGAVTSPMLGIRLKALKQIVELYDLDGGGQSEMCREVPYSTPEEIAVRVRERLLELHGVKGS